MLRLSCRRMIVDDSLPALLPVHRDALPLDTPLAFVTGSIGKRESQQRRSRPTRQKLTCKPGETKRRQKQQKRSRSKRASALGLRRNHEERDASSVQRAAWLTSKQLPILALFTPASEVTKAAAQTPTPVQMDPNPPCTK